jgi:hypothetical protein
MAEATKNQILVACRQWLKPLVHVLMRCGVSWKEFADLSRAAYVDVATREFGKRGRPTNVSRTAILTGLARREVRNQRARLEAMDEEWSSFTSKGSLALSRWHSDAQFLQADGTPAPLPLEGEGASMATLLHLCGAGDVRATTLLKELESAGAVQRDPDGRIRALKRNYIPQGMDEHLIRLWGSVLADIGTTYKHNLTRKPEVAARFERAAVSDRVRASALPEFREFVESQGQEFLERIDAWLVAHEIKETEADADKEKAIRLGVGAYHIQD